MELNGHGPARFPGSCDVMGMELRNSAGNVRPIFGKLAGMGWSVEPIR